MSISKGDALALKKRIDLRALRTYSTVVARLSWVKLMSAVY
jgi:hypothetical protein